MSHLLIRNLHSDSYPTGLKLRRFRPAVRFSHEIERESVVTVEADGTKQLYMLCHGWSAGKFAVLKHEPKGEPSVVKTWDLRPGKKGFTLSNGTCVGKIPNVSSGASYSTHFCLACLTHLRARSAPDPLSPRFRSKRCVSVVARSR
jgi:hypothetical protein